VISSKKKEHSYILTFKFLLNLFFKLRRTLKENGSVEEQLKDVRYSSYTIQKDDTYPKWKYTDWKQVAAVPYLQVVDLVDLDSILEEH